MSNSVYGLATYDEEHIREIGKLFFGILYIFYQIINKKNSCLKKFQQVSRTNFHPMHVMFY